MTKTWGWGIGVILGALFLFANAGFRDLVVRMREKRRIERSLTSLRADHQALAHEWSLIQQDTSYTEYLIRKNLGYVKKGEVEYQILKPKENS
jgi:cell division protein FtsB